MRSMTVLSQTALASSGSPERQHARADLLEERERLPESLQSVFLGEGRVFEAHMTHRVGAGGHLPWQVVRDGPGLGNGDLQPIHLADRARVLDGMRGDGSQVDRTVVPGGLAPIVDEVAVEILECGAA